VNVHSVWCDGCSILIRPEGTNSYIVLSEISGSQGGEYGNGRLLTFFAACGLVEVYRRFRGA
jgi:hypothetical protein